ncbi:MAG: hypothetical protein ABI051_09880 [Vicinamibacterales bacterium]
MKNQVSRLALAAAVACTVLAGHTTVVRGQQTAQASHVAWVEMVMRRMDTVKVGMTRVNLLQVFTPQQGGLSSGFSRVFLSRDCPYFAVDVDFEAVNRPFRDADGRMILSEDRADRIVKVSRPRLQQGIVMD